MESKFLTVGAINPMKPNVNIRLKLLSIETITRRNFDNGLPFMDIIAVDELGDRIGVVVKNQLKKKYEHILKEQEVYVIKNAFACTNPNKSKLAHWVHEQKLMITYKSQITAVTPTEWVGPHGFNFIPFGDLIACQIPEKATADVIGRVNFYNREPKSYANTTDEKSQYINLELKNLEYPPYLHFLGEVVSCTLFAGYMTQFLTYMKEIPKEQCVVLIIQFGRTAKFGKILTVGTDWNFTRIFMDTEIPAITKFKQSLLAMHNTEDSEQTLAPALTPSMTPPTKTLKEWFEGALCVECSDLKVNKTGTFVVHAEIIAIEPDEPWSYIACRKCHKKANTVTKDVDLTLDIDQQLSLKRNCPTCGDNPNVVLRFKVNVRVADVNGAATLTLFESQVTKFVKSSAYTIAKSMPADQDVPVELDALLDNTLLFKLEVTGYNKNFSTTTFTVIDATTDPSFIDKYHENFKVDKSKLVNLAVKDESSQVSESGKCASSSMASEKNHAIDLSNTTTGYTPPKKVVKQEPKASPLSVNCSSNRAKKSIDLGAINLGDA